VQLDLLSWVPPQPASAIVPFPMSRRIGEARTVASKVSAKATDAQRQLAFNRALSGLAARLARSGIEAYELDRQLDAFTVAVNHQLWIIEGRQRPGGAA